MIHCWCCVCVNHTIQNLYRLLLICVYVVGTVQDLYGAIEAEALSSGYTLGSCNWSLVCSGIKVTYVSTSSLLTTHAEVCSCVLM